MLEVNTGPRKQHALRLKVPVDDYKRNREIWSIKGQGQPIMCELANRNKEFEQEPRSRDPREWCYLPEDLLPWEYKMAKIVHPERQVTARYVENEDRNFALFEYINEQNNKIEALKDEIDKVSSSSLFVFPERLFRIWSSAPLVSLQETRNQLK